MSDGRLLPLPTEAWGQAKKLRLAHNKEPTTALPLQAEGLSETLNQAAEGSLQSIGSSRMHHMLLWVIVLTVSLLSLHGCLALHHHFHFIRVLFFALCSLVLNSRSELQDFPNTMFEADTIAQVGNHPF